MKPQREQLIAGIVQAHCACCGEPRALLNHVQLGPSRMLCPETGRTYLDRGDGLYQPDGHAIPPPVVEARAEPPAAAELLSDRPVRTGDKTRISLERATFA